MAGDDVFTATVPKTFIEDAEYENWEGDIDQTQLIRVEAAKEKIKTDGIISNAKDLSDGLYEKKWKNGLRIYFSVIEDEEGKKTVLILGSGKGKEQDKAIRKSKNLLQKYKVVKTNLKHAPQV